MELLHQPRLSVVDNAKAIGIILVVLGHIISPTYYLSNLIFSFQVPLFFALSGYLLSSRKLGLRLPEFTKHTAKRLLLPYLLFGLILFIPWALVFRHYGAGAGIAWFKPIVGIAYGLGTDGWLQQSPPLWFLPALFISTLVCFIISKQKTALQWPMALLAGSLGLLASLSPIKFPLSSANALLAIPFMLAGIHWRAKNYPTSAPGLGKYLLTILVAAILVVMVSFNGSSDFNAMRFGNYGILAYIPTACLGIILTVLIADIIPASRVAQAISTGTLYILALHIPFFTVIKGVALKLMHIPTSEWQINPVLIACITVVSVILSLLVQYAVTLVLSLKDRKVR